MIVRVQIGIRWTTLARWASNILLGAGVLMVIIVLWSEGERAFYQSVQARQFKQGVRDVVMTDPAHRKERPSTPLEPAPSLAHGLMRQLRRVSNLDSMDPLLIGRLEIPRLGLAAMVREGVETNTLRKAVGHMPGTALPGHPGNFVVAGHRDSFFRSLRSIRAGDEIRVETRAGAFTYYVETLSVVGASDVQGWI